MIRAPKKRQVLLIASPFGQTQVTGLASHNPSRLWLTLEPVAGAEPIPDEDWIKMGDLDPAVRAEMMTRVEPHATRGVNRRDGEVERVPLGRVTTAYLARSNVHVRLADGRDVNVTKASCICGGGQVGSASPSADRSYLTRMRTDLDLFPWLTVTPGGGINDTR